jgi:hypothetical protein
MSVLQVVVDSLSEAPYVTHWTHEAGARGARTLLSNES